MSAILQVQPEVREALVAGEPVVALETTLVAHGFPAPVGVEVAMVSEAAVRAAGAVPATIAVIDGRVRIGLSERELERLTPASRKLGPRDVGVCAAQGAVGATTVGATLIAAVAAGIRFMGTGGLGGVHRGYPSPPDVSADLDVIARSPVLVVSSGVKSLLDVPATMEVLETLGVPVLGFRTSTVPLFYAAAGGPPVSARIEAPDEAAAIASAHWQLGGHGLLVGQAPAESLDVEELIEAALVDAKAGGVTGQDVTPFVLAYLHARSDGRTLTVNRELIVANAGLAGKIAKAYCDL
jgi:pseudouridine-5'-phosphate glycosidase